MRTIQKTMWMVAMAVFLTGARAGLGAELASGEAAKAQAKAKEDAKAKARAAQEEVRAKARAAAEAARKALVEKLKPLLRQADPKLVEQAIEEAQRPVHPGEPGKQEFWNLRHGIVDERSRFIYPPSFGFEEVPGASQYRFDIAFGRGTERDKLAASFTADKPWRPLAPVWNKLRADTLKGIYVLRVVALDATGKELGPCKFKVGVGGGARQGRLGPDGKWADLSWSERDRVPFSKAPSFAGPYLDPIRDYDQAVLEACRPLLQSGLLSSLKSDEDIAKFGVAGNNEVSGPMGTSIAAMLCLHQLSPGPAEKKQALEVAQRGGEWLIRQCRNTYRPSGSYSSPQGLPGMYHGFVTHVHYTGLAYLDLYRATKDKKWLTAAEDLAQALAGLQQPKGNWTWTTLQNGKVCFEPHYGFFGLSSPDFDASEMLHFYGRLRKEGGCERFVEVEKKALQWMMDNSVKTFYWREHPGNDGPHQALGNVSPYPASYFVRYLLDWAEPSETNLKVAEEIVRFCEDQWIDWSRSGDGLGTPTGWSLFATIYMKLYEKTKRPLDLAKAEALANAALRDGETSNLHEYAEVLKRVKR